MKILSDKPEYCHDVRKWKVRYLTHKLFNRYSDALNFIKKHKSDVIKEVWGLHHKIKD